MARVGVDKILGTEVEVHASSDGTWEIQELGEERSTAIGRGETLDKAKNQARTTLNKRKIKVEVPFKTTSGNGIATGVHQRNRTILARINGEADEIRGSGTEVAYSPDTPDEVLHRIGEIDRQMRDLTRERRSLHLSHSIDLRSMVIRAIEEAVASAN